jgi:hypothetical protein
LLLVFLPSTVTQDSSEVWGCPRATLVRVIGS